MKVIITGKNFNTYKHLQDTMEKKFDKLGKFFSDDITVNVVLSQERGKDKIEATINAKGAVFRAEEVVPDIYEGIDRVVDKLSSQMSRFKGKLQRRYNDNKSVRFETLPEMEEEVEEVKVVRTKKFEHDFFVFLDMETDSVNVVYSRKDGNYGVLETTY